MATGERWHGWIASGFSVSIGGAGVCYRALPWLDAALAVAARASAEHISALSMYCQENPRRTLLKSNLDKAPDWSLGGEGAPVSLCGEGAVLCLLLQEDKVQHHSQGV